jgi:3'-phosphoadenosine 5'-phosphosulfate sulfotransferase (PAPS reductase)/FAD synthetase
MTFTRTDFIPGKDFSFDVPFLVREGFFDPVVLIAGAEQPTLFDVPSPVPLAGLAISGAQVAALSWADRERRVLHLLSFADLLYYQAGWFARNHGGQRQVAATAGMLSGGNDSTTAVYAMRRHLTHLVHADTGVCLSVTRQFVRQVAADLGKPLIIARARHPQDQYAAIVRERGFPGPARHAYVMNRLKERAWRQARRQLVADGRRQRIIQVAGRRRDESAARANVPEMQREDSVVWVSPMVFWTKPDLNTYRRMFQVPVNPVYDLLHYSGECLCGSHARPGEREWLLEWFPDDPAVLELTALERELAARDDIPPERRTWGCRGASARCVTGMCNE